MGSIWEVKPLCPPQFTKYIRQHNVQYFVLLEGLYKVFQNHRVLHNDRIPLQCHTTCESDSDDSSQRWCAESYVNAGCEV